MRIQEDPGKFVRTNQVVTCFFTLALGAFTLPQTAGYIRRFLAVKLAVAPGLAAGLALSLIHIYQAELDMLKMEPFTAKYAASANHQRQDDVGIFLVSCILSAVSGPFLFVYRICRLVRLTAALKRGDW